MATLKIPMLLSVLFIATGHSQTTCPPLGETLIGEWTCFPHLDDMSGPVPAGNMTQRTFTTFVTMNVLSLPLPAKTYSLT